ncbi:LynF/TruF/PatF family peptide O-prenyltransferase [Nostoc sp. CCY 9925]|uniref:LynF/TruF/PatF family peptide O-prenyltransferase n=1 Tax=Nostoc sp. CCY 9925 TaxID=3103865 RepID=UPI0039C67B54
MTLNYSFQQMNLRERRLQFIRSYCDAFDVEPTFALRLFEEAVLELEAPSGVEPICNVEGDRLFAVHFQVASYEHTWPRSLTDASNFLDKVESRIDLKINRNLLDRFSALYIGSSKIKNNTIGIDLRPTLHDSSIKIYMHITPGEGNEDLVMTAIALDGAEYSAELTEVLIKDVVIIGFNLFLDGRSNILIAAGSPGGKYKLQGSFGKHFTAYIQKNFSHKVISIFNVSDFVAASFSKEKIEPGLHFHFLNIKDIRRYFAFNSIGNKIYDFCQSQDCVTYAGVSTTEKELKSNRLDKYSFFYNQSDTCQSNLDKASLISMAAGITR